MSTALGGLKFSPLLFDQGRYLWTPVGALPSHPHKFGPPFLKLWIR